MKLGGISNLGVKLSHGVDHVVDWSVSFTQKAIDQYVGHGSYDVGVVHQWESCGYTHGKYDFQWSTQTQELSKYIRINTSKGRVETESVRAMKEQRGLLGVVGPLRNWSS